MFAQLKVSQKILVAVALVGTVLSIALAFSYLSFLDLRRGLEEVRNVGVPNAIVAKDMQMQVIQMQQWLTDISATRGMDGLDDGFKEAEKAHQTFQDDLTKIRNNCAAKGDHVCLALADNLKPEMAAWYATGKQMAQAYIDGGAPSGNKQMEGFDKVSSQLQGALEPLIASQLEQSGKNIDSAVVSARHVQIMTLGGILVAVGVLLIGGLLLANSIAKPLKTISVSMADMMARKDFTMQLPVMGNDELSSVTQSFNRLVSSLRQVLQTLQGEAKQVDETSTELSATVNISAHSAESTSEAASAMAAAVEQISVGLDQMKENASNASAMIERADRFSQEGGKVIHEAVAELDLLTNEVLEVAEEIVSLGQQTEQISSVVALIRDVAGQTNLLALNAAIEAARAGEQGRGFAVVADEVRKLAERTALATRDIESMITGIQGKAGSASTKMQQALSDANAGTNLGKDASDAIESIRGAVAESANVFRDIANGIAEQSSAGQSIANNVEKVALAAEESNNAARNVAQAATVLGGLARSIRGQTEQFKL